MEHQDGKKTEGFLAAVYNPKTGDIQTGVEHFDAYKKTPENAKGQYVEGFVDREGKFMTRQQALKEYGIKMSADIYKQT
jgi:hypothetical protein